MQGNGVQGGTGADGDDTDAGYHHHSTFHNIQKQNMAATQYPIVLHCLTPPFPIPKAWLARRDD